MMIVNADDFGRSAPVNRAVLRCFQQGLCSSATIMATGEGFEEACAIAHDYTLSDHVGLHVVLDAGVPLSDRIRHCRSLCDREGRFRPRTMRLFLTQEEKDCVAGEIAAQIKKARSRGMPITHLDSHHHVHELWPILSILLGIARDHRIPYVRLAVNCGPLKSIPLRMYRKCVNERIQRNGMARTRYFGSLANFLWHRENRNLCADDACEVMIHPTITSSDIVVDQANTAIPLNVRLPHDLRANMLSYTGNGYAWK